MKKSLLFFIACAFMAVNSYSQWSLTGNANATSTSVLGTTNAIPLSLVTKNAKRLVIDTLGRIGIGTASPINILTVKGAGSTPAASWVSAGAPLFVGFGETTAGNADYVLSMASATAGARPVFIGRRSKGTLAAPSVVSSNDYLMSFLSSGYDGSAFQNPAAIDFYVDGTPSAGNVPARISFVTGSNGSNRLERMKIGANGDVSITTGNLVVARKAIIKGIAGINGDTLSGTALNVNANAALNGIVVNDPADNYVLYADKSGANSGIYISKSSATSGSACITGAGAATSIGVEGYSSVNNGMYAQSDSAAALYATSATSIGVYAETGDQASYAGYFNGDVFSSGTFTSSDARLKSNVKDFGNALQLLGALQPRNYDFKHKGEYAALHLPTGNHYGLIAQELEKVMPQLVKETKVYVKDHRPGNLKKDNGFDKGHLINFKAVNYTELIPVMIKGMQELTVENTELKSEIVTLKSDLAEIKAMIKGTGNRDQQPVSLSSASFSQNVPNPPLNNSTKISYSLPPNAHLATIIITDSYGKTLKQIVPENTKTGAINLDTKGLSAGTYYYSLYVDSKLAETKKMIITGK